MTGPGIHPLCAILPPMSPAEYAMLRDDIRAKGLVHPITLHEGLILDGRHRYRACVEVGVSPRYETYAGSDPAGYVASSCVHRNLTTSQRALIAAGFLEYEREQARKRQLAAQNNSAGKAVKENFPELVSAQARDKAGARVHVSGRMVDDAAKVIAQAVPEVLDKVRSGDMAINEAKQIAGFNPTAQKRIVHMDNRKDRQRAILEAKARSESCKRRDNPIGPTVHPGTPFLRKWLNAMERIAIVLAEEGIRDSHAIVERFEQDMDWNSDALESQFDRCIEVIEAMHLLHLKHGKKSKPNLKVV